MREMPFGAALSDPRLREGAVRIPSGCAIAAIMDRSGARHDEPQGATPCPPERIDLIVVPGTAFTRAGARMGRGRGYYDRYLSRPGFHARTVGVCYTHQLLDTLPVEPHDVPLDRVIAG